MIMYVTLQVGVDVKDRFSASDMGLPITNAVSVLPGVMSVEFEGISYTPEGKFLIPNKVSEIREIYPEAECEWSHDRDMFVINDGNGSHLGEGTPSNEAWNDAWVNLNL